MSCYGGIGKVKEILSWNNHKFHVKVQDYRYFENNVSLFLPDGRCVEQLGTSETIDLQPASQSNHIRPISQEVLDYIINIGGLQNLPEKELAEDVDFLESELRDAVRSYFVDKDNSALYLIEHYASSIGRAKSIAETNADSSFRNLYHASKPLSERLSELMNHLHCMKMSYSYKPVLILALLHAGKNGKITIEKAADYVLAYYQDRKARGLAAEKKKCIYLRDEITKQQVIANLLSNPVKALCESGYFFYNENEQVFSLSPELWGALEKGSKAMITRICRQRLSAYYSE